MADERMSRFLMCIFAASACGILLACCGVPVSLYRMVFYTKTVDLNQSGWRFEARYDVGFGVGSDYERLSFDGKPFACTSLPQRVYLVTPIGEFGASPDVYDKPEWGALKTNSPIWSDQYRTLDSADGDPWRLQIPHELDKEKLAQQGWYQAPPRITDAPWTNRQLEGTPTYWIYVYTHTNQDGVSTTIGYWADPYRLDELGWDKD